MEEVWKDIKFIDTDGTSYDYTGLYQVSNLGRVRSLDRTIERMNNGVFSKSRLRGRVLNSHCVKEYLHVVLYKDGKRKEFRVHRLVAHMFVENPNANEFSIVNHRDENKINNHASNLEWCDTKYNANYGSAIDRRIESFKKSWKYNDRDFALKQSRSVVGVHVKTGEVVEFEMIKEAMQFLGLKSQSEITKCCKGKQKTCGGYTWSYKEEVV